MAFNNDNFVSMGEPLGEPGEEIYQGGDYANRDPIMHQPNNLNRQQPKEPEPAGLIRPGIRHRHNRDGPQAGQQPQYMERQDPGINRHNRRDDQLQHMGKQEHGRRNPGDRFLFYYIILLVTIVAAIVFVGILLNDCNTKYWELKVNCTKSETKLEAKEDKDKKDLDVQRNYNADMQDQKFMEGKLAQQVSGCKENIEKLENEIAELKIDNTKLKDDNKRLEDRVKQLLAKMPGGEK